MVANAFAILLGILAFGQQVVLAKFKFKFDNVTQCEPVSISFKGSDVPADSIPVTLTLLPFGAPPVAISIPNAAVNSSGVYVTFFPFPAKTQFVASLDDAEGDNSAKVSDIFQVLESDNDSCISGVEASNPPLFTVQETVTQCGAFTVKYNSSAPPTVRLFEPKGPSFALALTSNDVDLKTATYLMNFSRQNDIVLMLDSGMGQRVTTNLLHVGGDATTSDACLEKDDDNNKDDKKAEQSNTGSATTTVSNGTIIGISVGGGLVVLISVLVVLYILRERRRKLRGGQSVMFQPNLLSRSRSHDSMEKVLVREGFSPVPAPLPVATFNDTEGFVRNPAYAMVDYSPVESHFSGQSTPSWGNAMTSEKADRDWMSVSTRSRSTMRSDIAPDDIENMLNEALAQNQMGLPRTPGSRSSFGNFVFPRSPPTEGANLARNNTDLSNEHREARGFYPSGLNVSSTTLAHLSHASSSDLGIRTPPPAAFGLPSSPRNGLNRQASFRSQISGIGGFPRNLTVPEGSTTRDSVSSWGNIAR